MEQNTDKMRASYQLDIANAYDNSGKEIWKEADWLTFVRDRLVKMRAKRTELIEHIFDRAEVQQNMLDARDNEGNIIASIPIEQTLSEIEMGRTDGKINFDITPDGQADVEQLQPTKFALNFFMDGNGKDNFWKENKLIRQYKASYGSAIAFTGIRLYRDFRYQLKEDAEIIGDTDYVDDKKFERVDNDTWYFFPKAIHPKDFYIDDNACGQPDVQYADDCIFKEKVTATEFNNRYAKSPLFENVDMTQYWVDIQPKNVNDGSVDVRHVVLYHYYNRTYKKYIIMANETNIIYNGLYLYDDGKLPFVNIQHFSHPSRFWGIGFPERVAYLKEYKSEIFMDMMSGAQMNAGLHLLVGNDDQIGQDWTIGGRQMNLWRTTGGVDKVQPVQTSVNLSYMATVLDILDKQITIDTGINPMEQFEPQSDKVGIVEIMESNKSIRNKSRDENYNIGLDEMLTMMLARIRQFAPALLSEKIKGSDGKIIKQVFPKIRIDNYKVEKQNGKQVFTESIGKFGYFELKPEIIQGVSVKVTTPSTNSNIPLLERQKFTEYVNNINQLAMMAQLDQTGELMKKLKEQVNFEDIMKWMGDAFGYDMNGIKANSEKDKIFKENTDKIAKMREMLMEVTAPTDITSSLSQNVPNTTNTQAPVPSQPVQGSVGTAPVPPMMGGEGGGATPGSQPA